MPSFPSMGLNSSVMLALFSLPHFWVWASYDQLHPDIGARHRFAISGLPNSSVVLTDSVSPPMVSLNRHSPYRTVLLP